MGDGQPERESELLSAKAQGDEKWAVNGVPTWAKGAIVFALSVIFLIGLGSSETADLAGPQSRSHARVSAAGPTLHPQCMLPYQWVGNSTPTCYGRPWRQQNRRLWPDRSPRQEGARRQPTRLQCDQASADHIVDGHNVRTGLGGNQWYRFASPVGSDVQWGIPTEPQRQADASSAFDTYTCGTQATAWVSGWEPTSTQPPPTDYRSPGSLPGDGPQWPDMQWHNRIICFEGDTVPGSTFNSGVASESMIEGVLWEVWYDASGRSVDDLVDGDTRFPEWPTHRALITPVDPQPWGPNCGGSPLRQDPSVDLFAGQDCGAHPRAPSGSRPRATGVDNTVAQENRDGEGTFTALFESPTDIAEHFGTRMRSYFRPPETGHYVFSLASDDFGELWLGKGPGVNGISDQGAEMVASVPGWTEPREWDKYPEQTTRPIALRAGVFYTIDALVKENTGGDNLAVGVTLPGGTELRPIPVEFGERGLLFVDPVMHRYSSVAPAPASNYQSCMSSVRASAVHCGDYLLWRLPDVPSCEPITMAYCSAPESGLL